MIGTYVPYLLRQDNFALLYAEYLFNDPIGKLISMLCIQMCPPKSSLGPITSLPDSREGTYYLGGTNAPCKGFFAIPRLERRRNHCNYTVSSLSVPHHMIHMYIYLPNVLLVGPWILDV
jgi:hypothetical protein